MRWDWWLAYSFIFYALCFTYYAYNNAYYHYNIMILFAYNAYIAYSLMLGVCFSMLTLLIAPMSYSVAYAAGHSFNSRTFIKKYCELFNDLRHV